MTCLSNEQSKQNSTRLLVIRFSSFGDIVQASAVPAAFNQHYPGATVDWLVRADFADLLQHHQRLSKVIRFERQDGLSALCLLAWQLARSGAYSHVYDAHCNVRSRIVTFIFFLNGLVSGFRQMPRILVRSKNRLRRWLFFSFKLPVLPRPYRGAISFLEPLARWQVPIEMPQGTQFWAETPIPNAIQQELARLAKPLIALAPSAAWPMKRWPVEHWQKLITLLPEVSFAVLGGPKDDFIAAITQTAPERCLNLAGRLTLDESSAFLKLADLVIANDTGILHVADQMERPTLALIGPTAFGYPSHATSRTLEIDLACKPCSKDGRGRCSNSLYQRCLVELTPEMVAQAARLSLQL